MTLKQLRILREIARQARAHGIVDPELDAALADPALEERLQATFPGREIEVINTALTAVNSYTLLDQADEIAGQRPDAVLIYTGHNEYYGALGGRWRPAAQWHGRQWFR